MSLLQNEQLDKIEKQGKSRQIYKVEFFATVLGCIILSTFILSRYVPAEVSSIPMVFEAIIFAVIIGLLSSPWSGRLMPVVFVGACAVFIVFKIVGFQSPAAPGPFDSMWVWIVGVVLFAVILIGWKIVGYNNPVNKEAREYEKHMREIGRW